MDTMSTAGGTTVYDRRSSSREGDNSKRLPDHDDGFPKKPTQLIAKGKLKATFDGPFITDVDYMSEKRPFFVKIEKDGVLPALKKLDAELQKVCA
jgi:hypothetical protein